MSAEVPTPPSSDARRPRLPFLNGNREQVILFASLTLLLTVATVRGGLIWLRDSKTLTFAVGEANGPEARFAAKLAYELVRDEIGMRPEDLKRQRGHDDNVAIVKTAQSA